MECEVDESGEGSWGFYFLCTFLGKCSHKSQAWLETPSTNHRNQSSPLNRQSVIKGIKGMQTTEVLENVKCKKLGDERKTLEWQINDKLLILLLLLLLFSH